MVKVYLSLGSNMGRREVFLKRAVDCLQQNPAIRVEKSSSIYETSPVGPKQRAFLNSAVKIQTSLSPVELLKVIQAIEKKLGRKRTVLWGPRTIDIDLVDYAGKKLKTSQLTLPHPLAHERKFVLVPLSEIAPRLRLAGQKHSVSKLCSQLTGLHSVKNFL